MSSIRLLQITIGADPPPRLDKALSRDVPDTAALSRSRLAKLIAEGRVRRGDEVLDNPRARTVEGDEITLEFEESQDTDIVAQPIALDVVYEDDDLIVVNKPAGMVVHPAPGSPSGTLVNALLSHCGDSLSGVGGQRRPGIVHRIDKETSGLLVAAKTDRAHHGLAAQFEAHSVERHYTAFAHGVPDTGDPRLMGLAGVSSESGGIVRIETLVGRHRTDRQRQAVLSSGGRRAVTRARAVDRFGTPPGASILDCWLETGRTHQIRVHLAYCGHALLGDPVYSGRRRLSGKVFEPSTVRMAEEFPRQALHAATLGFVHPVSGQQMAFSAELPTDMIALAEKLRAGVLSHL